MKKLFIALLAIVLVSCSQDQNELVMPVATTTSSVLEGKLLSYKDDESFIKEYSALAEMKSSKDVQEWISKKGHSSLLNSSKFSSEFQDIVVNDRRIIYSNALKAILNNESKFKINGKLLWLEGINIYELNTENKYKNDLDLRKIINDLKIYGSVFNANSRTKKGLEDSAGRLTIPNINGRSFTYTNSANEKRYNMIIYNETIVVNNVSSSKMYLNAYMTYKSCSFWRCTYKEDTTTGRWISFDITIQQPWFSEVISGFGQVYRGTGSQTILLATMGIGPYQSFDFNIDGNVRMQVSNGFDWTQTF